MSHVPVLLWKQPLKGQVTAKGGAVAVCDGNRLTVLDTTGRIAFSDDLGSRPMGISLRGEGSMDGHVLAEDGLRTFTRKGVLRPSPPPPGAIRLLDEDSGRLLMLSREGVIVSNADGRGTPVVVQGTYLAGRMGPSMVLLSDRLEMRSRSGDEELSLEGDWVLLLGDEPYAMGDAIVRAGPGAFVASFDRDDSWLGGASIGPGILFWTAEGEGALVHRSGELLWSGALPGRVVAADASGPILADGASLSQLRFVEGGRTLVFEMLCQNPSRCGTFASLEYRPKCPSCGGEEISIRHAETDSEVLGG